MVATLLALLAPGLAQGAERKIVVTSHTEDGDFWFAVDGQGRNPVLVLEPGERVRVRFVNADNMAHSFHLGDPISQRTDILHPEGEETLTFTVPPAAEGTSRYWCDPHLQQGMIGPVAFGEAAAGDVALVEEERAPGPGVLAVVAVLALAASAGRGRQRSQ